MIAKSKPKNSWLTISLIVAAVAIWAYNQSQAPAVAGRTAPQIQPSARETARPPSQTGAYELHRNCKLAEARNNDGDSFQVNLPDGKKAEFRLYFVDTPESAFKSYSGGDNNHQRIRDQAADLGGITPEQAVETGKKAKAFSLGLLAASSFDLYTCWDSPFNDNRFHAFVEVQESGKPRWLHELLVEKGLVRIHTKGADLPDGTPSARHKTYLKSLEATARKNGAGAWGL